MFLYEALILGVVGSAIGGMLSLLGGYAVSTLDVADDKISVCPFKPH